MATAIKPGSKEWDKLVTRCLDAASKLSDSKWALGDESLKVWPWGENDPEYRDNFYVLADTVDVSVASMMAYRRTAHHWPPETRVPRTSHTAHTKAIARPEVLTSGMGSREVDHLLGNSDPVARKEINKMSASLSHVARITSQELDRDDPMFQNVVDNAMDAQLALHQFLERVPKKFKKNFRVVS